MSNYEAWTNDALIKHIKDLEARLQEYTATASNAAEGLNLVKGTRTEPKQKKVKLNADIRKFDFHKYQQKYVAFKFAYLGWHYNGLVTQEMATPLPTVEEEIFKALIKTHLIEHPDQCKFSRCGRTDKGVSAMGQVMALNVRSAFLKDESVDSTTKEFPWLEQLNGCLPHSIRILAYDDNIAPEFDARFSCRKRIYKYLIAPRVPGGKALDLEAMNRACQYFVGEHDFRNFCKLDASKQISNFKRTIEKCIIQDASQVHTDSDLLSDHPLGLWQLHLEGTAFLWHQVRCITGIVLLVGQGLEEPEIVRDLLDIVKYPTKPVYEMADDWPLTLYDCDFGDQVSWRYSMQGQRILDNSFHTLHEARIKDATSAYLVNAAMPGVPSESPRPGINLGDGKIRISAKYVPISQRKRLADVEVLNAAWAEKKQKKNAEKGILSRDADMTGV